MYHVKFLISLINLKTILFFTLTYTIFKCIIDHYFRNPRWIKFSNELPGPKVHPIVGTTVALLIGARGIYEFIDVSASSLVNLNQGYRINFLQTRNYAGFGQFLRNCMHTYGLTFRLWIGQDTLAAVLSDVNDIQTVLTSSSCLEKKTNNTPFKVLFGNSLVIASPTAVWKHKRKEYQPFFAKNILFGRVQEMNELNDKYVEKMKKEVDGPEFDLEQYMNDLSFDTILKTQFNYDISDEEREQLNMSRRLNEAFLRLAFNWFFNFSIPKTIVRCLQPVNVVKTKNMVHDFVDKVLNLMQKSPSWSSRKDEIETKNMKRETFTQSYIDKLFQLKEELNEADLVHSELLTIIIAGTETTGITMAFCFLALAAYPEIQEKAYQEIYRVFGDDKRPVDRSDLNKFPYLEQVIKETQRYFTIVPQIMRSIEKDIKIGNRTHPAGTAVMLNITGIHHNPEIYPHPNRFDPENFTPEAIQKRHKYSFIPFSAGPRNCIGKEYAELNMKLRLISFLRIFTFHTNVKLEDIKLRAGMLERSSIGYPVSVKLRRKISHK